MPVSKGNVPWNAGKSNGWTDKRGYRWLYVSENGCRVARREHRVIREVGRGVGYDRGLSGPDHPFGIVGGYSEKPN